MLLHILTLLFYAIASSSAHDWVQKNCKEMDCFVVNQCLSSPTSEQKLTKIDQSTYIKDSCGFILMARRYSELKWLFGLASIDPLVKTIKTEQNNEELKFSCFRTGKRRDSARAYFRSMEADLIDFELFKLRCVFLVNFEQAPSDMEMVNALVSREGKGGTTHEDLGHFNVHELVNIKRTCDPAAFKTDIEQDGDLTYERMVPQIEKIKCRKPFMQPQVKTNGGNFTNVTDITCKGLDWAIDGAAVPISRGDFTSIDARCVVDTFRMCDYSPRTSSHAYTPPTLTKGKNMSKLVCPESEPFWKIGHNPPFSGKAECVFAGVFKEQASYTWTIGGINITKKSDVRCVANLLCNKDAGVNQTLCNASNLCELKDDAPHCMNNTLLHCTTDDGTTGRCSVVCNGPDGTWVARIMGATYEDEGRFKLNALVKLACLAPAAKTEQQKRSYKAALAIGLSVVVLLIIVTVAGVGYYCWRQNRIDLENEGILTRRLTKKKPKKKGKKRRRSAPSPARLSKSTETPVAPPSSDSPAAATASAHLQQPPSDSTITPSVEALSVDVSCDPPSERITIKV